MSAGGPPRINYFDPAVFRGDRLDAGLTQGALALLAGVDQSSISQWERGQAVPSRAAYERVSQVLLEAEENTPPDWLWRRYQPAWDLDHADDWPGIPEGWEPS